MKIIRDLFSRGKKATPEQVQASIPDLTGQTPTSSNTVHDPKFGKCTRVTFGDGSAALYPHNQPIGLRPVRYEPAPKTPQLGSPSQP